MLGKYEAREILSNPECYRHYVEEKNDLLAKEPTTINKRMTFHVTNEKKRNSHYEYSLSLVE